MQCQWEPGRALRRDNRTETSGQRGVTTSSLEPLSLMPSRVPGDVEHCSLF